MAGLLDFLTPRGNSQGLINDPQFNLGVGLLSAAGPQQTPMSFGQRLQQGIGFAQQADARRQALENSKLNQQILLEQLSRAREQAERERQFIGLITPREISGLSPSGQAAAAEEGLSPSVLQAPINDPGSQGLLAAAAGIAPQAVAKGVIESQFATERADPAAVRVLEKAGIDPQSEVGRSALLASINAGGQEQQMRALELMIKAITIQNEQRELDTSITTEAQKRASLVSGIARDTQDAIELAQINKELRNTAGETGIPFSTLRRAATAGIGAVQDLLGIDSSKAKRVVSLIDRFNKKAVKFAAQTATKLFENDRITNFQFQMISSASPSLDVSTDANNAIIADTLEVILDGADNSGIEVRNRKQLEALIQQLRNESVEGGGKVIDFSELPP